ncbi:hypothetical protein C7999DRAFT_36231 [Corynascus novoguineensis]|uniref:NWD NACHT-NTPase N-terminal domain-containing protein n=1 Tax=Corynascus novoguineensis TaxID=1126955 RepID=A0AAN7CJY2_9PEZI|nr:hypothetical protein C7999DRAFT_36231 [Corynascus novoguineensis]
MCEKPLEKIASREVCARFPTSYSLAGPGLHTVNQSSKPRDNHHTKPPANDATIPCSDLDPSSADETAVRANTEGFQKAEASATVSHVLYQTLPIELQARERPAPESEGQQAPALSVSQTFWNAAYDCLEEDTDTAELVRATDLSVELKDPNQRQIHLRKLTEKGQVKISTSSKIIIEVGDVVQFILSVKPTIDAAVRNNPQAALPWAGVCIGSKLAGIMHIVSRMDWYCILSEHLLNKDHIGESPESMPAQLEARVIALYKALLLYQMKSVCSYYRHQAFEFLRALANWEDWDGYLEAVWHAEKCLDDSGQFD